MTEKRASRLSCERARAFPIEKALAKLGHFPTRTNNKEAWFLSPYRSETQASFKVSKKLNRWYDHGAGIGGNVIDIVCLITKWSIKEVLEFLSFDQISFSFQQQLIFKKEKEAGIEITRTGEIHHYALKDYVSSRKITIDIAKKLCKEVHYRIRGVDYYSIGLKNDSGGWELRNRYYKNSSSPKDITHVKNGNSKLIVTEGMFDMLSLLEKNTKLDSEFDFLIMNSAAFIKKVWSELKQYDFIDLYLDNDSTGRKLTQELLDCSKNCIDQSGLYEGFKDMNEKLMVEVKNDDGKGRQDVFL
ncbi:toprim domain-containing protein [Maribacter dokdonensis]|uniref:toprim domain-containing protein n=1 Tax=Maribacter dokdonensis TaxID=320912 RepID=UPI001C094AE3|nr:toprim domain-containing protein [Maribacter dokdonensis]MBU2900628.1 toprim domain-containing protein [Maribacter dokdonensis]